MPELYAYTDGACSGNPGPGGWGVLMVAKVRSSWIVSDHQSWRNHTSIQQT